jgi:hypothetical protein
LTNCAKRSTIGEVAEGQLTKQVVGREVDDEDKVKGYWFWGLVATFIAVPEVLAAVSDPLEADIPWPTISNLVGKDLEAHHHWIALIVVWLIAVVTLHTLTHPPEKKTLGRALRKSAEDVKRLGWGWRYIALTAAAGSLAGLLASVLGGDKNQVGYAIYVTLALFGIVIPSALAYWWHRVLAIPTLFATLALLQASHRWIAAFVAGWLVTLLFHLALYPWPNYHFGTP